MAHRLGGTLLLRIEDIDLERCRETYVTQMLDDLAWLGLTTWPEPVLRQSREFDAYRAAAAHLEAMGLLYPCFATRAEIAVVMAAARSDARTPDGSHVYPGLYTYLDPKRAHELHPGEPYALRIRMQRAIEIAREKLGGAPLTFTEIDADGTPSIVVAAPERWGDTVIVRKDVPTSYHLAVTVDDARQGVTHVTRGRDLFAATDIHRLLQVLLGLPEPLYHHHRLITDDDGRKLAKSARDTSLRELRHEGVTAADLRASLGF